jgi:nitroimidazol reductase NimA-like FMN-containing flavoprotein (pyridoxamine 5'-phosphate oxidase superfamily)
METDPEFSVRQLVLDECWHMLGRTGVGVLGTSTGGRPDLFPINYLVDGRTLLFRSAPGTKVADLEVTPHAAFAAQGRDDEGHWSVVVRGTVDILTDAVEVVGSGALELASWAPGSKRVFLRLVPGTVTGRRIPRADLARAALYR